MALSLDGILPTLERYLQELERAPEIRSPATPIPTSLVAYATTSAPPQPLSQHHANVLINLCHSVRELEEVTRTTGGKEMLVEYLGAVVAKNIINFWEDEWIA